MEAKNLDDILSEAVKEHINNFNERRGRRKELSPEFVNHIHGAYRKFGRSIDLNLYTEDDEIYRLHSEVVPKIAKMLVRSLLKLKPRPSEMAIDGVRHSDRSEYLFRLRVPRIKRKN